MWVAACLYVGLTDTYQLLRGQMTAKQAEQFYRSEWLLGPPCSGFTPGDPVSSRCPAGT